MADPGQRPLRLVGTGIEIVEREPIACVDLRGSPDDGKFMRAVASVTDVPPPVQPCTSASGLFGSILWLGPDEWLVTSESQAGDEITAEALGHDLFAVLDDHVLGRPVDGLLELPEDARRVLRPAPVDGDGVVVVEALDGLAGDTALVLRVEEARPDVRRIDDMCVGVEDLETLAHG